MKRTINCFALMLLCSMIASAQKQFTLEDLNFGGKNYQNMIPQTRNLAWHGNMLYHMEKDSIWAVDTKTGKEKLAFTSQQIKDWAGIDKAPNLKWASFPYPDKPLMMIYANDKRMLIDTKNHKTEWNQIINDESEAD